MDSSNNGGCGGVGLASLLTMVFVVLKLTGHIDWSWIWVLSPLWISFLLTVGFLVVVFLAMAVAMFWHLTTGRT